MNRHLGQKLHGTSHRLRSEVAPTSIVDPKFGPLQSGGGPERNMWEILGHQWVANSTQLVMAIITLVTAGIVAWYAIETRKLRVVPSGRQISLSGRISTL